MKKYQLTISISGKFLTRTEWQTWDEFKKVIEHLIPAIDGIPNAKVAFHRKDEIVWTTFDIKINAQNALDILTNLAEQE